MKNPKRTFLIGFVVGLLFFGWWLRGFLYINWRFGLFSWDSWYFLFHEISSGWRFSNRGDWIFLTSFILSFPLYFALWYLIDKIYWKKSVKKIRQYIKKEPKVSQPANTEKTPALKVNKAPPVSARRPIAMPSFGPTMRTKPLNKTADLPSISNMSDFEKSFTNEKSSPSASPSLKKANEGMLWNDFDSELKQMADTPLSEIQLPKVQAADEDIDNLLSNAGLTILPNISTLEKFDGWAAAAQGVLFWAIYDDAEGDWLADEEAFNDEDPLWFSETDHRVSPVFILSRKVQELTKKLSETNFKVQPILIERKGNLINAEDMLKTWNDLGVIVCRTSIGGPVQLKTVSEVLHEKYAPLSPEEMEKLKQVLL